jgi:hypothetical protein
VTRFASFGLLCALSLVSLSACRPASAPAEGGALAADDSPGLLASVPASLAERACTPSGPELCFNATDDNCNGIIDEGCGLHTGLVQFAAAWDEARADVDLRVFDPSGELVEVGRPARSGLVKERDCPGRNNDCHGQNLENVYLSDGDPVRVTFGARVGPKTYSHVLLLDAPEAEHELLFRL